MARRMKWLCGCYVAAELQTQTKKGIKKNKMHLFSRVKHCELQLDDIVKYQIFLFVFMVLIM